MMLKRSKQASNKAEKDFYKDFTCPLSSRFSVGPIFTFPEATASPKMAGVMCASRPAGLFVNTFIGRFNRYLYLEFLILFNHKSLKLLVAFPC